MGAIVIGCRYRLRPKYVESDRNPADKSSRETGRVCRRASSARPTPSPKKQTWQPVSIIREAGRPPGPSDVVAPTPSDCPCAPPGLPEPVCRPSAPMLPAVAVAAEKPVPPVAPAPLRRPSSSPVPKLPPRDVQPSASVPQAVSVSRCRGPRLGSTWGDAPPRISSASLPKLPRAQERLLEQARVLARKEKRRLAPGYLELFAGSCRFFSIMNECNCVFFLLLRSMVVVLSICLFHASKF